MTASTRTAIVADTTSYLPPEMLAEHDVHLVSLYVGLEGEQQRESDITDLDAFYERMRASDEAVTTSQPSVGDFIAAYEPLLSQGREIVSVHLSAGISGTCESAVQARERLSAEGKGGERIQIVDSRTAAGGMSLVLLAAANAVAKGASAEQASQAAEECRKTLKLWFAVDTLEYLRRGGRIGTAGAWLGTTLKIKPILTFEEEVEPVERVRTRARSIERLISYARQRHEDGADGWVVQHIQDPESADKLVGTCREIFGCEPVFCAELGPVLGAHAGPGMLGVGAVTRGSLGLD
ncbi:MAG TPA: DegV family protein [Solirubrobacterales bacterium]|nr:DegV family protein [Solirubrobacterales bacterium]